MSFGGQTKNHRSLLSVLVSMPGEVKYPTQGVKRQMGCSQKRCTKGGDRVRGCITHLLSIKNLNVDGFHVSVVINI